MIRALVALCCLALYATAQDYQCLPPEYCETQPYTRADRMGCQYFCYLDTAAPELELDCPELHTAFGFWNGGQLCDFACFQAGHIGVFDPPACDGELFGAFELLAHFDDVNDTISSPDIDGWCAYTKLLGGVEQTAPITPNAFARFWNILYQSIGDETCPNVRRRR